MTRINRNDWAKLDQRLRPHGFGLEHAIPGPVINRPDGGFIAILEGRVIDLESVRRFVEQLERPQ